MKKLKRVLITGGSGFLGVNLVRHLLKENYDVSVIDLEDFTYEDCRDNIRFVQGDIRNVSDLRRAFADVDVVVHAAAALPLYKKNDIYTTDVDGTRNVLEQARKQGIKRVVHISSTAVYGVPKVHPLFETSPLIGVGHYGRAKILAEKVCEEFRDKGMCIPILRPKSFVGPERLGVMAIYYDWIKRGKNIPIIGSGKNRYQLLDVEDLCRCITLCLRLPPEKTNSTFNVGAKEFTTLAQDFGAVLRYARSNKKIVPVPAKIIIPILVCLEKLKLSPLYKWVYETAHRDSYVDITKAQAVLGFVPRYSNQEALIRNYEWYLNNGNVGSSGVGVTHRKPWKQGMLTLVRFFF